MKDWGRKLSEEKEFFSVEETANLLKVDVRVLQFWEEQIPLFNPSINEKGKFYRKEDIETFMKIKDLLYKEGMTLSGVRRKLLQGRKEMEGSPLYNLLKEVKKELLLILTILENNDKN